MGQYDVMMETGIGLGTRMCVVKVWIEDSVPGRNRTARSHPTAGSRTSIYIYTNQNSIISHTHNIIHKHRNELGSNILFRMRYGAKHTPTHLPIAIVIITHTHTHTHILTSSYLAVHDGADTGGGATQVPMYKFLHIRTYR